MSGHEFRRRMILTDAEKKHWHQIMPDTEFDRIFGPRTHFEEGGPNLANNLSINAAVYGGLVNTLKDAIAYTKAILNENPTFASIPISALRAEDQSEVWHITLDSKFGHKGELVSFSRMNGKVLSGNP